MALRARLKDIIRRLDAGARAASMETVYQHIFERDVLSINADGVRFYPVGSAANYGLLYVLLRAALDYPIKEVLELGAGQTSILFDLLVRRGVLKSRIRTLEHDQGWADRVSQLVSHDVIRTHLVPKLVQGRQIAGYDFAQLTKNSTELLVIDGPPAGAVDNSFSRLAALELIDWINPYSFIIVVDDADREGEKLLAREIQSHLAARKIPFQIGSVVSNKKQIIIAGGDYVGAAYY
ncbi:MULTISPECIES: hypothetical protein [unclassified Bradyrhizobium]|uniref:hypothetical protein n=1 Tax=unclassified Bradyrhizobium TaxID=2631580 RepID=UPI0033947E2C